MIKSFRGQLADGGQDTIRLSTNNGLTGYKIKKLQLMGASPGSEILESIVKIYKYKQTAIDGNVQLEDSTLLGVAFYVSSTTEEWSTHNVIIFDNVTFNQDIFVTHHDVQTGTPVNYYIELEQVKLDINEATVATLKDMRGSN